jgi:hypothetical protein
MMFIMQESNFYNAIAVLYLDLVTFGTAAMLIYEDDDTVIRCYNPALGEFYLGQSHRLSVDTFAREFKQSVKQLKTNFGEDNLSEQLRAKCKEGGAQALHMYDVTHLIEPNYGDSGVPEKFRYMETYWETAAFTTGQVLARRGFNQLPGIFPRWELTANDSYGTSPAMDALPDVIQLQQETKRKAQGIDKMVNPPIVADIQLEHRPTALMPNGMECCRNRRLRLRMRKSKSSTCRSCQPPNQLWRRHRPSAGCSSLGSQLVWLQRWHRFRTGRNSSATTARPLASRPVT